MTRYDMLQRMPAPELSDWIAYASIEPIGEARADMRAAMICCTFANYFKASQGSKTPPCKLEDFMLKFDPPEQQTNEDMKAMLGIRGK